MLGARITADAGEVSRLFGQLRDAMPAARRAVFHSLAIQTQRAAFKLASGASIGPTRVKRGKLQGSGNYPIPVRTGRFRRGFAFQADSEGAVVFNDSEYAMALHEGFKPYGNPHARPIRARRYFADALDKLDLGAAQAAFDKALPR